MNSDTNQQSNDQYSRNETFLNYQLLNYCKLEIKRKNY